MAHCLWVVEVIHRPGEMLPVVLEPMFRQGLYRTPEVPQRNFVLARQADDDGVDVVIALQVIAFGRQDGDDPPIDQVIDDLAQFDFEDFRSPYLIGPEGEQSKARAVNAKLAVQWGLIRLA